MRKVIEAYVEEDFVVDFDIDNMYCVSLDWSPKTRPKYFKELDKAEAYAKKSLRSSIQKKTIVPGMYKTVTITKGNKEIEKFSQDNI